MLCAAAKPRPAAQVNVPNAAQAERPELKRFEGTIGRVVTVNWNNKAVIDFQDGGWYDITASTDYLQKLDPAEAKAKFNAKVNSAQPIPEKQG